MLRLCIQYALFCCRSGHYNDAMKYTRRAIAYANKERNQVAAGHLLAALQRGM